MVEAMKQSSLSYSQLKSYCRVQTPYGNDKFVGFRIIDDSPEVWFPLGYRFPAKFAQLQADIFSLISVIQRAVQSFPEAESNLEKGDKLRNAEFPFQDYVILIEDYMQRSALYSETLSEYRKSLSGVIAWPRTIAKIKPALSSSKKPVYIEFIAKRIRTNEDSLITLIHEYCLFLAFKTVGWLFSQCSFPRPRLMKATEEHMYIVARRLGTVFNDRNRRLLTAMFNILSRNSKVQKGNYEFGTDRFEYVWEYMVDRAFGERMEEKGKYFPKAEWQLVSGENRFPAPLEPDTIMPSAGDLYVLDAKYYRFGVTGKPIHLPGTSDIGKQVIYGQYARKKASGLVNSVYNAFIIPGEIVSSKAWSRVVAVATPAWIDQPKSYERVITVIIDTTYLLRNYDSVGNLQKQELGRLIAN